LRVNETDSAPTRPPPPRQTQYYVPPPPYQPYNGQPYTTAFYQPYPTPEPPHYTYHRSENTYTTIYEDNTYYWAPTFVVPNYAQPSYTYVFPTYVAPTPVGPGKLPSEIHHLLRFNIKSRFCAYASSYKSMGSRLSSSSPLLGQQFLLQCYFRFLNRQLQWRNLPLPQRSF
jgi:hypothetical protein